MKRYEFKAGESGGAELIIYGEIGQNPWSEQSVEARDIVDALADLDANARLSVRINSPGGIVADGLAIYNALRRHRGPSVAYVDAQAFSAASVIAMGADEIEMARASVMMVHGPSTIAAGKSEDMREAAKALDRMAVAMGAAYRGRGIDAETVDAWLSDGKDHYFTADEAVSAGLADRISSALPIAATAEKEKTVNDSEKRDIKIAERDRIAAIRALGKLDIVSMLDASQRDKIIDEAIAKDWTEDATTRAFMTALSALKHSAGPLGGGQSGLGATGGDRPAIQPGADAREKMAEGMQAVIDIRMGLDSKGEIQRAQSGNEFMGMSVPELGRRWLESRGKRIKGANRNQLMGEVLTFRADGGITHTTSDFPALLENSLNKAVLRGWEETPETWSRISSIGNIPDFRPAPRSALGEYPTLPEIPEGGEYKYVTLTDRKETIVLLTYGSKIGITRQALVNDDLAQFGRIGIKQGRAASRRVGDLVYATLTGNPLMEQDGIALFDAQHNNIASVIGPPRVDTVDNMKTLMALQKDDAQHAHGLNIPLAKVIVPVGLETQANVLRASQYDPDSTSRANSRAPNPFQNTFEVVADPRLDQDSATQWYASADPMMYDVIEAGFLDGATEPYLESREGWNIDGLEAKVRIDAAAIPLDFRTMTRNAGA